MTSPELVTVQFTTWMQPSAADMRSFHNRAQFVKDFGGISDAPDSFDIQPSRVPGFWSVILRVKPEDRAFWLGYAHALQMASDRPHLIGATKDEETPR